MSTLMDIELELEQEMIARGAARYRSLVEKAKKRGQESTTVYGEKLTHSALEAVAQAIGEWGHKALTGSPTKKPLAAMCLKTTPAHVAAYITLKELLDGITTSRPLTSVCWKIGSALELEAKMAFLAEKDKRQAEQIEKKLKKTTRKTTRHASMNNMVNKHVEGEWKEWGKNARFNVGRSLFEITQEATGYAITTHAKHRRMSAETTLFVVGDPVLLDWINRKHADWELLTPEMLPTIIPPKPWTGPKDGGYYTKELQLNLVKTRNGAFLDELESWQMPEVYRAVNALQDTGYTVNERVLDVMRTLWEQGGDNAGLPNRENKPLPPCPVCGADLSRSAAARQKHECLTGVDEVTLKSWKKQAAIVRCDNGTSLSRRLLVEKTIHLGEKFLGQTIYFPHQLDYRGRIYPVPAYLQPQGADYAKGLLLFAEGAPLGEYGEKWLAIHGANSAGIDKVSFTDRIAWVQTNEDRILATAADPYADLWWAEVDCPWQFLAFCFEWADSRREGPSYVSHLPVAVDGTCNGLQVYSLLLRDPVGGKATNLIRPDNDKPADVYQVVADKVIDKLKEMVESGEDVLKEDGTVKWNTANMAQKWMGLDISRKTTKRQVMVLPYGGSMTSCREYTEVWLKEQLSGGKANPFGDSTYKSSCFLADLIWSAIGTTVVAAREAMDALQKLARALAKVERRVGWVTPVGFPVWHHQMKTTCKRIYVNYDGREVEIKTVEDTGKIDPNKQASGIAPHFVHSLDAAILVRTTNKCLDNNIASFAMVHDSYGCLAGHMETMGRLLREAAVEMATLHDPLGDLWDIAARELASADQDIIKKKKVTLPPKPTVGELDLNAVLESPYFFA